MGCFTNYFMWRADLPSIGDLFANDVIRPVEWVEHQRGCLCHSYFISIPIINGRFVQMIVRPV